MKLAHLTINSTKLDYTFITRAPLSITQKLEIIYKKYLCILKHRYQPFILGSSTIHLGNKNYYYNSPLYGFASLQAEYTIHYPLLKKINLPQSAHIIDGGASVGNFSVMIRRCYPTAHIYAFEPTPHSYHALKKNFDNDTLFTPYNLALASVSGELQLKYNPDLPEISTPDDKGNLKVQTTTLDAFCQKNKITTIDLLKLDVESYEQEVLKGAKESLKNIKHILIEVTLHNNHNYTITSLLQLLTNKDYNFQLVDLYTYYGENEIYMLDLLLKNINL
jgi:FkbM family methyltransferase